MKSGAKIRHHDHHRDEETTERCSCVVHPPNNIDVTIAGAASLILRIIPNTPTYVRLANGHPLEETKELFSLYRVRSNVV